MTARISNLLMFCLGLNSHFLDDIRKTTKDDITIINQICEAPLVQQTTKTNRQMCAGQTVKYSPYLAVRF